jgi:chromate reductase, NAD(P)H dehydrogenase (quinone)
MHILLISGSTRPGSGRTLALQNLHELDRPGVTTELYEGLTDLAAFIPAQDPVPTR